MGKYKFPLQKLLEVKQYQEDQKAIDLKIAQHKLLQEEEALNRLIEKKMVLLNASNDNGINMSLVRSGHDYLQQINDEITRQKNSVTVAQNDVNASRDVLAKANQEKKSVEILNDKHFEEYKRKMNRLAQINENEVALRMAFDKVM